jgi:hypothetical protein
MNDVSPSFISYKSLLASRDRILEVEQVPLLIDVCLCSVPFVYSYASFAVLPSLLVHLCDCADVALKICHSLTVAYELKKKTAGSNKSFLLLLFAFLVSGWGGTTIASVLIGSSRLHGAERLLTSGETYSIVLTGLFFCGCPRCHL